MFFEYKCTYFLKCTSSIIFLVQDGENEATESAQEDSEEQASLSQEAEADARFVLITHRIVDKNLLPFCNGCTC